MRLCVFSNVYGDVDALDNVLKAVKECNPDMVVCGGDLVGHGKKPNEVIEMVQSLHIPTLMGDWDFAVGYDLFREKVIGDGVGTIEMLRTAWSETSQTVTYENKRYLQGLLGRMVLQVYGKTIMIIHGNSERAASNRLCTDEDGLASSVFREERWDLLILGHMPTPEIRGFGDRMVAYSGSVGGPNGNAQRTFIEVIVGENCIKPIIHKVTMEAPKEDETRQWEEGWSPLPVNYSESSGDECRY